MSDDRQLAMKARLDRSLPEMGPLPPRMSLHAADGHERASWNWIIKAAFNDERQDYSMIENDPGCAPDRVFFLRHARMDVATASALTERGEGWIHMVGIHPAYAGMGCGRFVVLEAMNCLKRLGFKECKLSTDDFRLPAIRTYLNLGFEPFYDADDTEMKARWEAVFVKLNEYRKPDHTPIRLWPEGCSPDLEACGGREPALIPFPVEGSKGAMIVCPGGGYTHLAPHEGEPIARMINLAGISAFVLMYRVKPFPSLETPLSEAKRAIRLVRSMGYEKVAIMGFSAGGHLSGMAATLYDAGDPDAADPVERLSSRPDAFAPCYGATSLWHFRKNEWPGMLLEQKSPDMKDVIHYSAECNVTADTPPAFIWHTADDRVVTVACALDLAKALTAKGVPHEMHIFPHGEHGLGLAGDQEDVRQWAPLCQKWLLSLGFGRD
ncbi:MAG: GNAT family N-acetyltransferase [Clostridia bacterium]|nr:GNAT family N-acetyltransferase [Clostridia bacterium]